MSRPWPTGGLLRSEKEKKIEYNVICLQEASVSRSVPTLLYGPRTNLCDNPLTIFEDYLKQKHNHKHAFSCTKMELYSRLCYCDMPIRCNRHLALTMTLTQRQLRRSGVNGACVGRQRRCTVLPATAPHWARDLHTLTLAGEEGATASSYGCA